MKNNIEELINRFNQIYNYKYNYSLVNYINNKTKIKIICDCGNIFEQTTDKHLIGRGCKICKRKIPHKLSMNKNLFISKVNKIHNNKYDYSLVEYKNSYTKIKIICPIHGIFEQQPRIHLHSGCVKCINEERTKTTLDFIFNAKNIYKDIFDSDFDYSLVNYINNKTKVKIICSIHGIFEQTPINHLQGYGCKFCSKERIKVKTDEFIKRAKLIHNNKYNYIFSVCNNAKDKVRIICPIHGEYSQKVANHLFGTGCRKCADIKHRLKMIKRIEENKLNGHQLMPMFNKSACKIFDEISLKENIHIQHAMNGGEYHIKELGYWLDGYDKDNNVVYEFDEEYHKYQIEKDKIRQQEIEYVLKCKFIRINYKEYGNVQ